MSKQDDKRIEALAKKNAAKSNPPKKDRRAQYDDTLRIGNAEDRETQRLFKEMKKREF